MSEVGRLLEGPCRRPEAAKLDYTCAAVRMGGCAMRKWAVLLFLAGSAWPAMAAKSVSVGQLEQLLDTLHGKSDGKVAQELSDLELTERVSPIRLAHWEKEFPGSKSPRGADETGRSRGILEPSCRGRGSDSRAGQRNPGADAGAGQRIREKHDHAAAKLYCYAGNHAL